jgi:hypothetical protein
MLADVGCVNQTTTTIAGLPVFVTDTVTNLTVCEICDLVEQLFVGEIRIDRTIGLENFTTIHS